MKPYQRPQKHKSFDKEFKTSKKEISFEQKFKQFKKAVEKSGIIQECRKREYYEKPAQKKQRKRAEAIRRQKRKDFENDLVLKKRLY